MKLVRTGNASCSKNADSIYAWGDKSVRATFRSVGRGREKRSDFRVEFVWDDVEELLKLFFVRSHPKAQKIIFSRELYNAVRRAGWKPKD
jgi:hypothetical protein